MPASPGFAGNLRHLLLAVARGCPTRREINDVVSLCVDLAAALLRRKIPYAMLASRLHYTDHRDLAFDCIGELCQQGRGPTLPRVQSYLAGIDLEAADAAELLLCLRRLVTSSVNQTLFRVYGETDPHLAKILRNVKLAARSAPGLVTLEILGTWYAVSTLADRNGHLPALEQPDLEAELSARGCSGKTVPEILRHLSCFLVEQTTHARMVPLLEVARSIRLLYTQAEMAGEPCVQPHGDFTGDDVQSVIRRTCRAVRGEFEPRYVGKKTVSTRLFGAYMAVVEQTLNDRLWGSDDALDSMYERLLVFEPALSKEEYYRRHRSVLEYLSRLSFDRVVNRLRTEFQEGESLNSGTLRRS